MSSIKFKIPLFDIDWTLLRGQNPVHNDAFDYALHEVYQAHGAFKKENTTEGGVDLQYLVEILGNHGYSEEEVKNKMDQAMNEMGNYFKTHADEADYILMPGVKKLLDILKSEGVLIGLLTGNVENIGWEKLKRAGIKDYFAFGVFGSMVYKRADLIPIAQKKAAEILKIEVPLKYLVLVGDSPRDIACAKETGLQIIATGSGVHSEEELGEADLIVKSLEEIDRIIEFLKI